MSSQIHECFRRYEKKYLLNDNQYDLLRERLRGKLNVDKYGEALICNIYFDTPEHLLIRNSLEKPVYKEKLRLRSYGTPDVGDMVFIELKKKFNGVVYKRREKLELGLAEQYLYNDKTFFYPSQIGKEIKWFINYYKGIKPTMYISYHRIAMQGELDSDLRITFDNNLLWREDKLCLEYGAFGNRLLDEEVRLMEIKIPGAMPIWLSLLLSELEIYPISYSKYGTAYQRSVQLGHQFISDNKVVDRIHTYMDLETSRFQVSGSSTLKIANE